MARALILLCFSLVFESCTIIQPDTQIVYLGPDVVSIEEYIQSHVTYKAETNGRDYWQFPAETLALGTGDCEDFSILFMSALKAIGIDAHGIELVSLATPLLSHMTVKIADTYFDPTWDTWFPDYTGWGFYAEYSFPEILQIAQNLYRHESP